jgi:hypothetical protein
MTTTTMPSPADVRTAIAQQRTVPSADDMRREARRLATMARLRAADAHAQWMRKRRQDAVRNGMRHDVPLTREEASKRTLAALARAGR